MLMSTNMGIYEKVMQRLPEITSKASQRVVAEQLGIKQATVSNMLTGKSVPRFDTIAKALELLGAKVIFPDEDTQTPHLAREVCFANPVVKGVAPYAEFESRLTPQGDDYLAVPLVKEVGAGHGLIDEAKISDWVVVHASSLPRPTTPALCAVRVGQHQRSMTPLLQPGDLVLVDKGRYEPTDDGKIWMVKDPEGGGEMIKRVATTQRDGDLELIFYSDNVPEYRPETWRLQRDFGGDIKNAIVGRVIWAWTDVTRK